MSLQTPIIRLVYVSMVFLLPLVCSLKNKINVTNVDLELAGS